MARTGSTQRLSLGTLPPTFTLPDPHGNSWSLQDCAKGKPLVVVFACNHCPYVIHVRDALGQLSNEFQPKGISFVAINSNDIAQYPDDAPEKCRLSPKQVDGTFPT